MCILSDIAVSAPFEGSGVVYIYHGQQMDVQGSIINTTIQQVYLIVLHYVVHCVIICSVLMELM